jgi:hypothetical protein
MDWRNLFRDDQKYWLNRKMARERQEREDILRSRDRELLRQKPTEPYKPMMVVDLMNDLEREVNITERVKEQLKKPIDVPRQDFRRNPMTMSAISFSSFAFTTGMSPFQIEQSQQQRHTNRNSDIDMLPVLQIELQQSGTESNVLQVNPVIQKGINAKIQKEAGNH